MLIQFKSALMSAGIVAAIAVIGYVSSVGDVFKLDPHALVNAAALSAIAALGSFLKSLMTDSEGKVLGVKIK